MKHFPFILSTAVALALSACGNSQSSSSADDTVSEDSIPAIIEEVKAEHHEDEGKVIADLNFFINEKDFDKNKDKYLADIRNEHLMQYNIGNYQATWVSGYFENDSLYYVEFKGQPFDIDDYETRLIPQYKELVNLYKSKYGAPSSERSTFPESYETKDGNTYLPSQWNLGKRTISIGLKDQSPYYMINLQIYRNDITERINKRSEIEKQANRKSAESVI